MVDYLFLASNFNAYAGPNNHLLDMCNYLYTNSKKTLALVTNLGITESNFLKDVRFPVLSILGGVSPMEKLVHSPNNVKIIRNIIVRFLPRKIFVNSSIDIAFQTYLAANSPLLVGYNVFLNFPKVALDKNLASSVFFNILEGFASRKLVKKIVAHTNFHRKLYMSIGIEPSKICRVPHCIDLNRIKRALKSGHVERKNDVPLILFVGRLTADKGIMELLRAYESISKGIRIDLLIIGSGPLENRVLEKKRLVEKKHANARITHIRRVIPPKLTCLMNIADVIAVPSHCELLGMVVLEAMALKKTVVATCFGGVSEVITNGVNGVLANPFDILQWKSCLEEVVLDPSKRSKLGNAAYETVKNQYAVSVVAPRFIEFLEAQS